jgi:membrane peptidoglycan carboxypeptidase
VIGQIVDNGNNIQLNITRRQVLSPAEAADVDYALSFDTNCNVGACGTAVPNGELTPVRPTIGKTGTTDNFQSAFFLGAFPQYSMAVGMFTNEQDGKAGGQSLSVLPSVNGQAGGFGGTWPATIWRTFMNNEFNGLTVDPLPTPNFSCCTASGAPFIKWNQAPNLPRKPKKHHDHNPNPNPNPSPSCKHRHLGCPPLPGTLPTPPNPNPNPSPQASGSPTPSPSTSATTGGPLAGTNALGAVLLLAAEDPTTTPVRRPGGG